MKIKRILKDIFGYSNFREGQESCVNSILNGVDTMAIMPTGGGKSICYQLPSIIFDGLTIVVSPLISLMKDQTDSLQQLNIKSTFLNSTLNREEIIERIEKIKKGRYRIIYITPEKSSDPIFRLWIKKLKVSHIAIDEAHCISKWGHDFRPSYLNIKKFIEIFPKKPILSAFTATATKEVFNDIIELLDMKNPNIVKTGVERKNLSFNVVKDIEKKSFTLDFIKDHNNRSGIIYVSTRKECNSLYETIKNSGYNVSKYHGGMSEQLRKKAQDDFIFDRVKIMIATNAFGMGIDKSNVRYVIHYNMPGDLESYYQEAGRAGRDTLLSECILLYDPKDINIQKFFIRNSDAERDVIEIKYNKLETMIDYCNSGMCLSKFINNYFNEPTKKLCGNCSSCLDNSSSVDVTTDCQKVISCLIRMGKKTDIHDLSRVLKGIKSKEIKYKGYEELTTFSIMSHFTFSELENFYHFMKSREILNIDDDSIYLGKNYKNVLNGTERVIRKKINKRTNDSPLFIELESIRNSIAEEEGIAPYFIFSDFTLKDIEKQKPANLEEFTNIEGVGYYKAQRYGSKFLHLFKTNENQLKKIYRFHDNGFKKDIHYDKRQELLTMLKDGHTLENICNIYQLREKRAEKMIYRAIEENNFSEWEKIIPLDLEKKARDIIESKGLAILKSKNVEDLFEISSFELNLFNIKFKMEN
ncbi:MAG: DNA helicase RecQ [Candidatus Cloacimonadota bacterium]|nr:MAG: DNA helicase RecQ [Candidatus Cloacimonadota bacterium]PIE80061.1 MAG: DNA helicase RecQ [Candidatus Delongbacteria bacterium]